MKEPNLILGIGELLWDVLPDGPRLGGAPANFTVMAGRLGNHAIILSRIGADDLGREAVRRLGSLPADTAYLQTDPSHETGRVTVSFINGQPEYTIHHPAAWDSMELSDEWLSLAERAGAICFGTLAQRSLESRKTIQALARRTSSRCHRIFDVNLRAPFYSADTIRESLALATVVKMNDVEMPLVLSMLGLPAQGDNSAGALSLAAAKLLSEFPSLHLVAITRGGHGSLLIGREDRHEHPGYPIKVADTIGAGDAFTAAMTHYLLRGAGLATLNEAGNRWGGWVASQSGAMPSLPDSVRTEISTAIERTE
ncbi:MAG TPA: carbohydrate kinase [Terracidiphilus sp.]|nr:carbohydrate kinase [Terracidiphilus sp.]